MVLGHGRWHGAASWKCGLLTPTNHNPMPVTTHVCHIHVWHRQVHLYPRTLRCTGVLSGPVCSPFGMGNIILLADSGMRDGNT